VLKPPSEDIKDFLEANGVGVFGADRGWAIYIGFEPDKPDTTITLFDLPGREPTYSSGIEYPAIQVRVRAGPGRYPDGWHKAAEIRALLAMSGAFRVGGVDYTAWVDLDVNFLQHDESHRPIFVATYRLMRRDPDHAG